ncbi:heme lyase CcmF/NrfE family subunit [Leminorella grimontii]|uniref:heme lyase CcmF/NrfE family subunit n=1 Tax=Leminorella grimontii TaxID=82981 RepID=UPI0020895A08|nr:heme lyase CcmF/NrfE family subunit [Leminorella grimontii]GKX60022.1 c-type cytochrome biogenesis protein CcmF [Leminorella grimontii]
MIPELGLLSLLGALALSLLLSIVPPVGLFCRRSLLTRYGAPLSYGACLFITLSIALLGYSFATDDFSVMYVAQHSNSQLPVFFKVAAVWGGHEGSMLFWLFSLSVWTALLAAFSRRMDPQVSAAALAVLGLIMVGFCLFILFFSNPFERAFSSTMAALMEGRDLNPMLQDVGLIFHPPLLYLGYVGFAVNFALAIAALASGKMDAAVAHWSRPWALAAWICLTGGIILGSWWAYYELGWGGWWFWDPVENASLMPWLLGTALLHSLIVTERRGAFSYWSLLLSIFTFALSLLGTFIVRSGVLTSVHAFAVDPDRGIMLLLLLGLAVMGALTLFALRANTQPSAARFGLLSRETMLLAANVLLSVATLIVLIGTFYPMLFTAFGLGSISVGAPYFNATFVPPALLALSVMGISALSRWKSMGAGTGRRLAVLALLAAAVGVGGALLFDRFYPMVALSLALAAWVCLSNLSMVRRLSLRRCGVWLAHCGVAVTTVGIVISSYYSIETGVKMAQGSEARLGDYRFNYQETRLLVGPNYTSEQAVISVTKADKNVATLMPERRHYTVRTMLMSEPGISWGIFGDVYAIMGEKVERDSYALRFHYKPFIRWVWGGGLLMMLGGILLLVGRIRSRKEVTS